MSKRKRILNSIQKRRKLERQKELEREKKQFLLDNGFEGKILLKHCRYSWKRIYEILTLEDDEEYIYTCAEYILGAWCNKTKEFSAKEIIQYYEKFSNENLKKEIYFLKELVGEENSSGKAGHVVIDISEDKVYLETIRIPRLEKLEYEILYFSNKHTLHSLLVLTCYLLSICTEDLREEIFIVMRKYVKNNIAQLKKDFI